MKDFLKVLLNYYFVCMRGFFFLYKCQYPIYIPGPGGDQKRLLSSPGSGVRCYELPCGCWDLGRLEEDLSPALSF